MITNQTIITELNRLTDLQVLVETYKVIASSSMQRIRGSVLQNRAFHLGLNRIFQEVKRAYQHELARPHKTNQKNFPVGMQPQIEKTVFILFSANAGLYGDIVIKTFNFFLESASKAPADLVIIGKMGKTLFEDAIPHRPHTYFDFPDNRIDLSVLKEITQFLARYEKVIAFYGVFKNFVIQEPTASSISGDELVPDKEVAREVKYLFEPALEHAVVFFEKEIFASLVEQTFNESRLAKLASRMMLLDRSTQNIRNELKEKTFEKQRVHHQFLNKKQLNALSGIALWGV